MFVSPQFFDTRRKHSTPFAAPTQLLFLLAQKKAGRRFPFTLLYTQNKIVLA
jgi:hypothetical protein